MENTQIQRQIRNEQYLKDGKEIYFALKEKYLPDSPENIDHITNALCAALTCVMHQFVKTEDQMKFVLLVRHILVKNTRAQE